MPEFDARELVDAETLAGKIFQAWAILCVLTEHGELLRPPSRALYQQVGQQVKRVLLEGGEKDKEELNRLYYQTAVSCTNDHRCVPLLSAIVAGLKVLGLTPGVGMMALRLISQELIRYVDI